jgi:hypothetical protein
LAFERRPELREALQRNLERGGLGNVQVLDGAWSAGPGELRDGSATGLDGAIAALGLSRVDMIHVAADAGLDALAVIEGGRAVLERFQPELALELDDAALRARGRDLGELLECLEGLGYRYFGFQPRAAHGSGELTRERVLQRARERSFRILCRPA